ncbi:sensor histidine kinase [Allostreptomyces psammosilenae]|uniref:histidine kinase n=1 Tax=Allostreptomyces psammosilenae TaxID=1892865 RepID=A0A853ACK5_9ACTN|nr:nitrate- and nitrite sensing domain-containing protein [Allostreptomyces psammosilenae]NYI08188.1 signal transduction histidine kinase [Allostreptomyces psammosilenae]
MPFRSGSIRTKIVALLLVPLLSLTALWVYTAIVAMRDLQGRLSLDEANQRVVTPVGEVVYELQIERRASAEFLAGGDPAVREQLDEQHGATDARIDRLTELAGGVEAVREEFGDRTADTVADFERALDELSALRGRVLASSVEPGEAIAAYNSIVDAAFQIVPVLTLTEDADLAHRAGNVQDFSWAREMLAREDTLLVAGVAAGEMTVVESHEFLGMVHTQRLLFADSVRDLNSDEQRAYQRLIESEEYGELRATEDAVMGASAAETLDVVDAERWREAMDQTLTTLRVIENDAATTTREEARPYTMGLVLQLVLGTGLGLVALVASIIISVRVARQLIAELTDLRNAASTLATSRLPAVVRRLRTGREVDIAKEAPPLYTSDDEIGEVALAFNKVQRTAVESAVELAELRQGVSRVFVNIARRSQALVHRQLTLLDEMERKASSPEELEDLFRLDHMTTRMRRHAEGLIILSGAAPGRAWRQPVQLVDVVRAAVAEIEDYSRVTVRRMPRVALLGTAVADVTHLIAELIENAAVFSPPNTNVLVHGSPVPAGFALEIEDRGLGMSKVMLDDINERLSKPVEFDLSDTDRLGLFVVGRLAQRHELRVTLRPSPYGGTTAVVLIPQELLQNEEPGAIGGASATQTAALAAVQAAAQGGAAQVGASASTGPAAVGARPSAAALPAGTSGGASGGTSGAEAASPSGAGSLAGTAAAPSGSPATTASSPTGSADAASSLPSSSGATATASPASPAATGAGTAGRQDGPGARLVHLPVQRAARDGREAAAADTQRDAWDDGDDARTVALRPEGLRRQPGQPAATGPSGLPRRQVSRPAGAPEATTEAAPAASTGSRRSDTAKAADGAPAPVVDPATGGVSRGVTRVGLPKRVRQASLVPQLREDQRPDKTTGQGTDTGATAPATGDPATPEPTERTAEDIRATMASLQQGWTLGRLEAGEPDIGTSPEREQPRPGASADEATSERDGR